MISLNLRPIQNNIIVCGRNLQEPNIGQFPIGNCPFSRLDQWIWYRHRWCSMFQFRDFRERTRNHQWQSSLYLMLLIHDYPDFFVDFHELTIYCFHILQWHQYFHKVLSDHQSQKQRHSWILQNTEKFAFNKHSYKRFRRK